MHSYLARLEVHYLVWAPIYFNTTCMHHMLDKQNIFSVNIFLPMIFSICFECWKEPSHWDGIFEYPLHMFGWHTLNQRHYSYLAHFFNLDAEMMKIVSSKWMQASIWPAPNVDTMTSQITCSALVIRLHQLKPPSYTQNVYSAWYRLKEIIFQLYHGSIIFLAFYTRHFYLQIGYGLVHMGFWYLAYWQQLRLV